MDKSKQKNNKEEKVSVKYFLKSLTFIKPYKVFLFLITIGCIFTSLFSIFTPFFTQGLMNAFTQQDLMGLLKNGLFICLTLIVSNFSAMLFFGSFSQKFQRSVTLHIQNKLLRATLNLKTKNFDMYGSGKLTGVINSTPGKLAGVYVSIIDYTCVILSQVAVFVYIFIANPWLGIYSLVEALIMCLFWTYRTKVRRQNMEESQKKGDISRSNVTELVKGSRDIKSYNIQENVIEKIGGSLKDAATTDSKFAIKQYYLQRASGICSNLLNFGFIVLCFLLIKFDITTFAAAFTVYIFRGKVSSMFNCISYVYEKVSDGASFSKRIYDVLDGYYEGVEEFPEKSAFGKLPRRKDIEIKDLSFSYNDKNEVLNNFSLKVLQGQKIALVGESGSGKSTIVKLLNKSYDVERGKIFIGGENYDIADYSKEDLRNMITIVPQDPYIFNFTVRENLLLINPKATQRELDKACKKAQIYDFIKSLPDGYETKLGEGGIMLSGGQKQRLAIARSFLKDSDILIFDEATSSLDNENQAKIKEVIDNISSNKTVIIVAHRLSTIVDTDVIYFMKKGQIIASGCHKELLETCEEYKNLYKNES